MDVHIIASNLNVPWEITWGPDKELAEILSYVRTFGTNNATPNNI